MGKKGREIVKANLDEVISDLTKAYADEWLAHYQYWLTAQWISGIDVDAIRPILLAQSTDELTHAQKLVNRIIQLGGTPVMDYAKILDNSKCGYKEPPKDRTNIKQVIKDVLTAERCAIDFYSKMVEKYRNTDIITHELFEDLLKDEVDDEEEWERLEG